MCATRKSFNITKESLIHLFLGVSLLILGPRQSIASEKAPNGSGSRFLVLNDCDDDNNLGTAPYGDIVYLMDSRGELIRIVARDLQITNKCSGLSVSEDGRFFTVCDRSSNILTVYEVATGRKLWSLSGIFNSAVFANDLVYTSNSDSVYAIDRKGVIVKHARMGAFVFTVDRCCDCFWISGLDVKKCNLDLEPMLTVERLKGIKGPLFVETSPDGSIWLAQGDVCEQNAGENRLVKASPEGKVLLNIYLEFHPQCVCVDKSNRNVWVTGEIEGRRDFLRIGDEWPETLQALNELTKTETLTITQKFDSEGRLLLSIAKGGNSLVVDPFDGSVWITDKISIAHFSSTGEKLSIHTDVPNGPKWLALVPGR